MSVNILSMQARSWRQLWPLYLLIIVLLACALLVWQFWPQILLQSVLWQKNLHQQMTALLQQVASHPQKAGLTLMGFSLLYGVLHALGPGHGKVVIATFLATHPTRVKTSLQLTMMAAVVQGGVAIALVTIMLVVLKLSSRQLHLSSYWLEKSSYLLVAGLGVWLCWRAARKLMRTLRTSGKTGGITIHRIVPTDHQHSESCGCGHQHVPDSAQLATAVGWKTKSLVVMSMGMRPCSGAIMMLLFSKVIGVYGWGVLSAIAMALGTALTVSGMALLVQISRILALRLSRDRPAAGWQKVALNCLALSGGILLLAAGIVLWLSAQPDISGGIRPLFTR
ncbi:nickel/cobalt transporter [Erwinia sp. S43]|uniref:nickel/cobalt transporter n=1 Tax=unclassified Erwinia TaxID=2622719 RepID=UPI00190A38AB|nr:MULTISPECIES: nickel/cobalt transporter [unclassified Erwinia]MBK0033960.1 nickel/cobalt transporter [Erwinia sp. S43]MCW1875280.1 nickel/cobalt transporter [Erwinia sp. INIA01]